MIVTIGGPLPETAGILTGCIAAVTSMGGQAPLGAFSGLNVTAGAVPGEYVAYAGFTEW
jgi:hypothetical protein